MRRPREGRRCTGTMALREQEKATSPAAEGRGLDAGTSGAGRRAQPTSPVTAARCAARSPHHPATFRAPSALKSLNSSAAKAVWALASRVQETPSTRQAAIGWLPGHHFLGTAPRFPCECGTASNPGPGELALVDFNGDGKIDLSDPLGTLAFLFLGGNRARSTFRSPAVRTAASRRCRGGPPNPRAGAARSLDGSSASGPMIARSSLSRSCGSIEMARDFVNGSEHAIKARARRAAGRD